MPTVTYPVRPRPDALSLYLAHEGCALVAVNAFLKRYPSALSGLRDRDDLVSDAMLVLWHCCQRFDPTKGVDLPVFAVKSIQLRLFDKWRQSTLRTENGRRVRLPTFLSLSEPVGEYGGSALAECLPSPSGGGRWGSDGITALLHRERLDEARQGWESKAPWLKAKCPGMAAELGAVFGDRG